MARPLRGEYPGAFYHVINRKNNQELIFKNDRDKEKLLDILTKGRKNKKVRKMATQIASDLSGMSCKNLGLYFGALRGELITIV